MEFFRPYYSDNMKRHLEQALAGTHWQARGPYTRRVETLLAERTDRPTWLLSSCTHALELAFQLLDLEPGDEVILPSWAFPSAANAVLLAGGTVRYAPVDPISQCLDPDRIAPLVGPRTKAVLVVHYAGVSHRIQDLARYCRQRGLFLIEDAAQAFGSRVDGRMLGTFGDFGTFSFHASKNAGCGEGGALCAAHLTPTGRTRIERWLEKGTDRMAFERGETARYEWKGPGSSPIASDLLAALLLGALEDWDESQRQRMERYERYRTWFLRHADPDRTHFSGRLAPETEHNAHLFYFIAPDRPAAERLIQDMRQSGVPLYRHFVPLHCSSYGRRFLRGEEDLKHEEHLAGCLLRLPLYSQMDPACQDRVLAALAHAFRGTHG